MSECADVASDLSHDRPRLERYVTEPKVTFTSYVKYASDARSRNIVPWTRDRWQYRKGVIKIDGLVGQLKKTRAYFRGGRNFVPSDFMREDCLQKFLAEVQASEQAEVPTGTLYVLLTDSGRGSPWETRRELNEGSTPECFEEAQRTTLAPGTSLRRFRDCNTAPRWHALDGPDEEERNDAMRQTGGKRKMKMNAARSKRQRERAKEERGKAELKRTADRSMGTIDNGDIGAERDKGQRSSSRHSQPLYNEGGDDTIMREDSAYQEYHEYLGTGEPDDTQALQPEYLSMEPELHRQDTGAQTGSEPLPLTNEVIGNYEPWVAHAEMGGMLGYVNDPQDQTYGWDPDYIWRDVQ